MIAIPLHCFQELSTALSRCKIQAPKDGCSYLLDRKDNRIGAINWHVPSITIYEDYEYCEEVIEAIGKENFEDRSEKEWEDDNYKPDHDTGEPIPGAVIDMLIS